MNKISEDNKLSEKTNSGIAIYFEIVVIFNQ